ncbi:hypothetical protein PWT90_09206 [Aphanocladium album]|nr:hypothetical protein PWT90_09206 [Aphanocladium album]
MVDSLRDSSESPDSDAKEPPSTTSERNGARSNRAVEYEKGPQIPIPCMRCVRPMMGNRTSGSPDCFETVRADKKPKTAFNTSRCWDCNLGKKSCVAIPSPLVPLALEMISCFRVMPDPSKPPKSFNDARSAFKVAISVFEKPEWKTMALIDKTELDELRSRVDAFQIAFVQLQNAGEMSRVLAASVAAGAS